MKGDNIEINGQGVVYSNNIISVTNGGTFIFSGNLMMVRFILIMKSLHT